MSGDQHLSEVSPAALLAEAQAVVHPLSILTRRIPTGFAADLVGSDGTVFDPSYGSGPDSLLAALAAEQRYLVEQEGHGSVRGHTYVDKARERVRRGPQSSPPPGAE